MSGVPRISVILPTYNGGAALLPAVRSLREQSWHDWEMILLDDGSTDGSISAIAELGDGRIRIVSDGRNRGLAARLNQGVALARGAYIARMDADDIALPERLAMQCEFLDAHPEIDLLGCRMVVFDHEAKWARLSLQPELHEQICARLWSGVAMAHPTWMGRVDWFRANPYAMPEYVRAEDQELLIRAAPHSRYACLPEVLFAYRQNGFKLTRTQRARRSLLRAQCGLFFARKEWRNLGLSVLAYGIKTGIDLLSALPGADQLFFRRMGCELPSELFRTLHAAGVPLPRIES